MFGLRRIDLLLLALVVGGLMTLALRPHDATHVLFEVHDPPPGIDTVRVDVRGAVRAPGVITAPPGARVVDMLALAGGIADDADTAALNLARRVVDEDRIEVPRRGERAALLDLNTASQAALEALPGIGPVTARAIIAARPYTSTDELVDRRIVPQSTYTRVRDLVRVAP